MAVVSLHAMTTMPTVNVSFDDVHALDGFDGSRVATKNDELAQRREVLGRDATEFGFEGVLEFAAGLRGARRQCEGHDAGRKDQASA